MSEFKFTNPTSSQFWKDRYQKNEETVTENFYRVAKHVGKTELERKEYYNMMLLGLFFPAGRTMSNSGVGESLTLNNCFIAPQIQDSLEDIFKKVSLGAMTHQKGGGIGYDFSNIRPEGQPTSNDAIASGPISFMAVFDAQTSTILQGGRRGANMGVLNIYHPDVRKFINAKSTDANVLKHFNLSVMVDDNFMKAVETNKEIYLHYPVYNDDGTICNNKDKWTVCQKVKAKEIWEEIMLMAYNNGEPGIFFYDNMNKDNNLSYIERIVCSNPCSEYLAGTLYGNNPISREKLVSSEFGGACNLGSLFLHNFVKNPFTSRACIDYNLLKETIFSAVKMLDDVIDANTFPNKIYENYQKSFRTIGLGETGLADMLCMMNFKYNSKEAVDFVDELYAFISAQAYKASIKLARERGSFPFLDREKFVQSGFIQKHEKYPCWKGIKEDILKYGIRNAKLLSVAPTGTLSLTFGNNCSSGIEPIFSLSYERKAKIGGQDDSNIQIIKVEDYAYAEWKKIKDNHDCVVSKDIFVTAMDMHVNEHIEMLSKIAYHTDMSVSKTINVPTDYPFEETKNIYMDCWKNGIKGCTIFRPNEIRQGILIAEGNKEKEKEKEKKSQEIPILKRGDIIECSSNLVGKKRKLISGCGSLHVLAYFDPSTGEMQEVYLNKGSTGGCVDADTEYFNGKEWKKISEYQEGSFEQVLQYHEDGSASLTYPIAYIVNENVKSLKRFSNQYGLDMVLSDDHRMYLYKNYRKYDMGIRSKLTSEIVSVKEYLSRSGSKERHVPTTFSFKASGIPISDNLIRLLVSVYADGTFDGNKIVFSFKKERKKARLRKLLTDCDIGWTERPIAKTDYTHFYVHLVPSIREWFIDKQFTSKWYNCTDEQLKIIIDECIYWDGTEGIGDRSDEYFSSKKEEVDFIQFALTRLGFRATISRNDSPTAISYKVRWTKQNVHNLRFAKIEDYETIDGRSYCFTVPSGLLVLRRNNKIFITGNCANFMTGLSRTLSLLCRAGVDVNTIKDQLDSTGACPSYAIRSATKHDTSKGSCCPMAVGNALVEMWEEMQSEIVWEDEEEETKEEEDSCVKKESENKKPILEINEKKGPVCPECGESLSFEGGCNICKSCGWSKCS